MTDLLQVAAADCRYALRALRRNRSLSVAAILCFALGIGANTAIFSVVDAVLFRPLPFPHSDRLVLVGEGIPSMGSENFGVISTPEFDDYRALDGRVFQQSGIFASASFVVSGTGQAERVAGAEISASLFPTLGVQPAHGRAPGSVDERAGAQEIVLLSDALWRRRFDADASIIGRSITLDGKNVVVVGVMPRAFVFPLPGLGVNAADVFVPLRLTADVARTRGNSFGTFLVARLANGVTIDAARSAVADVAKSLPRKYPGSYGVTNSPVADVFSLHDRAVGDARRSLLVLLAAVGLVLLIACINVSSLLLARASARRRELSVRRALGATRGRLAQQFLAESTVLVAIGGALGIGLSVVGVRLLATLAPEALLQAADVSVNGRVLAVAAAIAIVTAILFSFVPAFERSEGTLASSLHDEARGSSGGRARQRARRTLVIAEIAVAFVVATGAGLMVKSLMRAQRTEPGFDPAGLITFRVSLPAYRYPSSVRVAQIEDELTRDLARVPGVTATTAANVIPMTGGFQIAFSVENAATSNASISQATLVLPRYFGTMRIARFAGRYFDSADRAGTASVAIVNETLAKRYFAGSSPIGKRLKWGSARSDSPWATIVGVVADVKLRGLDQNNEPAIYFPAAQQDSLVVNGSLRALDYVVRAPGGSATVAASVRQIVHAIDPDVPVVGLRPITAVVSQSVATRRFNTLLLTGFALLALVLAAAGIYGLMAYAVLQRTKEIGIRMAIGATPASVLSLVVRQGVRVAAIGVGIGVAGATLMTRLLRALLFDLSALDPLTFASAAAVLFLVATLAVWLPARRAAHIDPQVAVRAE